MAQTINAGKIQYGIGFQIDKTGLNELKTQLNNLKDFIPAPGQLIKMDPSLNKDMSKAGKKMVDIQKTILEVEVAFDNAFNTKTGLMNLQKLNTSLKQIDVKRIATNFSYMGKEGEKAFYQIAKKALTAEMQFKKTNTLLDKMGQTLTNTLKWQISSSAINRFTGAIQQAYGYVQHLDSSLNDIRIVTGKSADEMERFARTANKAAKSLGASTTDYTEAALIYYQQGLSDEEANARAATTLKAANVTGQSGAAVSEELTAVWNGYKVSAEETELAVDKLAAVAATTAADLEELSVGMSKVASAANNMGVDMDQLNAMIATIVSITRQAPESVGTALKTIFARMSDLKLGDTDEDGLKLGDVSGSLEKVGISILDTNGDLREMGNVIEEVAGKWDTWTKAQQAAIAQSLAGKRQYNNLVALFDNWDMYSQAINTSRNSMGTLQKQQDIYMESTEAHLQVLQTQWEDLYDSLLDEKTINKLTDSLTEIIKLVTNFIDSIGGGNTLFTMLGATAIRVFDKQLAHGIVNFINNIRRSKDNLAQLEAQLNNIALFDKFKGFSQATDSLVQAQKAISQYYSYMNNEQINEANNLAKQIGDVENLKQEWVDSTKALVEYGNATQELVDNYDGYGNGAIKENISDYDITKYEDLSNFSDSMKNAFGVSKEIIETFTKNLAQVNKETDNIYKTIKDINGVAATTSSLSGGFLDQEELDKVEQSLKNIQTQSTKLHKKFNLLSKTKLLENLSPEQISNINEAFADMQKLSIDSTYDEINAAVGKLDINLRNLPKEAKNALGIIERIFNQGREPLEEYDRHINLLNGALEQLGETAKLERLITSITGTVGAMGQIASSVSALKNLGNIWTDENLSGSEKMLQTLTNIGFSLPMLISAYGRYKDSLFTIIQHTREKNGLTELEIRLQKQLINNQFSRNALLEAWDGLSKKEQANYLKRQGLQRMDITLLNEQQQKELALMRVRKASTKILSGITAGLAIAAAGYSIISSVISSYNKRKEEEKQAYIESKKALAEEAQARVDERNKILEVKDSLTDLINEYKKANISREDFIIQSYQTIEGLDGEAIAALNTAKSWQEASKAVDDYYARVSESNVKDLTEKNENLLKAVAKSSPSIEYKDGELYLKGFSYLEGEEKEKFISSVLSENEDYKKAKEAQSQIKQEQISAAGYRSGLSYAQTETEFEEGSELYKNYLKELGFSTQEIQTAYLDYLKKGISDNKYAKQTLEIQSKADIITDAYFGDSFTGDVYSTHFYQEVVDFVKEAEAQGLEEGIAYVDWSFLKDDNSLGEKAIEAVKNALIKNKDELREGFLNIVPEISTTLSKALSEGLEGSLDLSSEDYEGFIDNIQKLNKFGEYDLTDEIEIFTNEGLIGTEKWTQAVYALQEALNDLSFEKMSNDFSNSLDNIDFAIDDISTLKDQLKDLTDQDYTISVKIHSDAEEAFNNTSNALNNIDEMTSKIGESFIVAADDLRELNNTFPGILEGMEYLADGTVQLNEEVVKSAMEAASQEEKADTEATITKLQNSATELRAKADIYDEMAQLAYNAAEGKVEADEAASKISVKLEKIEAENDKVATDTEIKNAHLVVDDSAENAPRLAENWIESYQEASRAANDWADVAVAAHEAALTGDASKKKDFGVTYQGNVQKSSEVRKAHNAEFGDADRDSGSWKELGRYYEDQAEALREQANDIEGMAFELGAKAIKSISDNAGVGLAEDESSSSSEKEAKHEEYLEREYDIYRKINTELDQIGNKLDRIDEIESHSWGVSYLDALQEENKLLDEQLEKLEEKKALQIGDLGQRKKQLENEGFTFNEDGSLITNAEDRLDALYANYNANYVDKYNSMSADAQEEFEAEMKAEEDRIKQIEDAVGDYEKLYGDYEDLIKELQDLYYKQIEKDVEEFNFEINLKLELSDARKEWNDFWHDVVKDVDSDDFVGQIAKSFSKLGELIGVGGSSNNDVLGLTQHLKETLDEVNTQITTHGLDGLFGTDTKLSEENLTNYRDKLMSALRDAKTEIENISDNYLSMLESAQDMIDKQVEGWENIGDQINHNIELIKLISGENSYDALAKQYEQQYENNLQTIEAQRIGRDYWKERIAEYKELLANAEEGTEEYKTLKKALEESTQKYIEANKNLNASVEESIKNLQEWRENSISAIMDTLDKSMSGGLGTDILEQEWKLINDYADQYFDNVERAVNMEEYTNILQDAANATGLTAENQAKINEFMDEELKKLNEKEKLTQYDIDESKARLEILKAEMALQDAQQNKSNMRLRRDSQGNYTYQYTGNEQAIEDAEKAGLTARKAWYELVKKRNKETNDYIIQLEKDRVSLMKQLDEAELAGDTEKATKIKELLNRNEEQILFAYEEAQKTKQDLFSGTAQYFENVENAEILPMWEATVTQLVDDFAGDKKDSFITACKNAIIDLEGVQQAYADQTKEILTTAGIEYQKLVEEGIDPAKDSLEDLNGSNEELAQGLEETNKLLDEMNDKLVEASTAYENFKDDAVSAIQAANQALEELARTHMNVVNQINSTPINSLDGGSGFTGSGGSSSSGGGSGGGGYTPTPTTPISKKPYLALNYPDKDQAYPEYAVLNPDKTTVIEQGILYPNSNSQFELLKSKEMTFANYEKDASIGVPVKINGKSWMIRRLKGTSVPKQYAMMGDGGKYVGGNWQFKSGGYTGNWSGQGVDGIGGRMAVLHQKELVLNESDTSNMLAAVKALRQIDVDKLAQSILATSIATAQMQLQTQLLSAQLTGLRDQYESVRNTTINADFSGVRTADEILRAFEELENYGLQQYNTGDASYRSY